MKKVLLLLLGLITVNAFSADSVRVKRYAILVGANDGGDGRAILRYAESDAIMMKDVLSDVGGIDTSNSILLLNPDKKALNRSFNNIKKVMEKSTSDVRTELIFYYSGHSDEEGLLMREDHYYYNELKQALESTTADVKIGILDSCSSGAFTQLKGGKHSAPFLVDESVKTTGHAYITSASETEAAQESNRLQASFFTHFLVSALRGAADTSSDGKVTLHEAYSYAQSETLARTERTQAGAQHASYDFRLSGSGDIVLTDLRDADSNLILMESDYGRFFIRDADDNLIGEVNKKYGSRLKLSVPESTYSVIKEVDGNYYRQEVIVYENTIQEVGIKDYDEFVPESNVVRGHSKEFIEYELNVPEATAIFGWSQRDKIRTAKTDISLFAKAGNLEGFQMSLANLVANDVFGGQIAAFMNVGGGDFSGGQFASFFNVVGGNIENYGLQLSGLFNWVTYGSDSLTLQTAGLFNKIGSDTEGFTVQTSGLFNTIGGNSHSLTFQTSGLFNMAGNILGSQISSIFNAAGRVRGVQLSGVVNYAKDVSGVQMSAVYNRASDVHGFQLALINTADFVYGTQIGLININKDIKGIPLGLINISTEGMKKLSYHYNMIKEKHYLNYQFGSSILYNLAYLGVPNDLSNIDSFSLGIGGGFHFPLWELYAEIDGSIENNFDVIGGFNYKNSSPVIRGKIALPLWDDVSVYVGATIDFPAFDFVGYDYESIEEFKYSYYFGISI